MFRRIVVVVFIFYSLVVMLIVFAQNPVPDRVRCGNAQN